MFDIRQFGDFITQSSLLQNDRINMARQQKRDPPKRVPSIGKSDLLDQLSSL